MQNNPAENNSSLTDQQISDAYWSSKSDYNYMGLFPERFKNQVLFATEKLLPRLKTTNHVLDLGCADGWFAFVLSRCVQTIDAFDLSEKLLERARTIGAQLGITNVNFKQADIANLTLNTTYDHALCMGLFTCIFDDQLMANTLALAYRHVANGGTLSLKDTLTLGNSDVQFKENDYSACYRARDNYVSIVEKAGFRLLAEDYLSRTGPNNSCSKCFLFEK